MDVNGDGINTAEDVLTSSVTAVHVYLDTSHNRDGSAAVATSSCNGYPLDMVSFDVLVHSGGSGSVIYNGFMKGPSMASFTPFNPISVEGADAGVSFSGVNYLQPGLYELGVFSVSVTGTPTLRFLPETPSLFNQTPITGFSADKAVDLSNRDVQERLSHSAVPALFKLAEAWRGARADLDDAREDAELATMTSELEAEVERLEEELRLALVEKDPADEKDVIVEIRQGVGGDEAALWAGDVYRMLTRYAERRRFRTETLSTSENEAGGFKEITFAIKGDGA